MHYSCRRPEFHSRAQAKGLIMPVTPASRRCDILFWPLQAPICAYILPPPHTHRVFHLRLCVCAHLCAWYPHNSEGDIRLPRTRVTNISELSFRCWEPNSGSLHSIQVFLITEQPL